MFDAEMKNSLREIAGELGVSPASLMAVVRVESGGRYSARVKGHDEPLIRFEGHYFYRLLPRQKRSRAVVRGLANARAGRVANPFRQSARWAMLARAIEIDRPAALASVSWGVGQVMGAHWRWLGYASIDALVVDARSGLDGQVRLMARFIRKAGLIEKLADCDWAGFARSYNGPGYARNQYDRRMAAAYRKFVKEGESGANIATRAGQRHSMAMLRLGSRGESVLDSQNQLGAVGYHLARDGDFGPATQKAVKRFQRSSRLLADGIVGPKTFQVLMRKIPIVLVG